MDHGHSFDLQLGFLVVHLIRYLRQLLVSLREGHHGASPQPGIALVPVLADGFGEDPCSLGRKTQGLHLDGDRFLEAWGETG